MDDVAVDERRENLGPDARKEGDGTKLHKAIEAGLAAGTAATAAVAKTATERIDAVNDKLARYWKTGKEVGAFALVLFLCYRMYDDIQSERKASEIRADRREETSRIHDEARTQAIVAKLDALNISLNAHNSESHAGRLATAALVREITGRYSPPAREPPEKKGTHKKLDDE
jgi:putative Mn2+ efflux pump MntP